MKKTHIVLLVLVAAAISIVVAMFADFSTYETFASAAKQPGRQFHVMGYLQKDKAMSYDPLKDPNKFTFFVKDKGGNVSEVQFTGAKPTDIEKSEQIVMSGHMDGSVFKCKQIQMKCPSKYKNDQIAVGS